MMDPVISADPIGPSEEPPPNGGPLTQSEISRFGISESEISRFENTAEPGFIDHFSLDAPSSTVRFRNAKVHVYERRDDQLLLEDRRNDVGLPRRMTVKRMNNGSFGMTLLKMIYALVALLMAGFLFAFCFQVLLFLFINNPDKNDAATIVFSLPIFLYGMGSLMAIASTFVRDTWQGHPLLRDMTNWSVVVTEWISFVLYLLIPLLTVAITLLSGTEDFWNISAWVWLCSVSVFFAGFALLVALTELEACFYFVGLKESEETVEEDSKWKRWVRMAKCAVLGRQFSKYSGVREEFYLVDGTQEPPKSGYALSAEHKAFKTYESWYSIVVRKVFDGTLFERLDPPMRVYTVEEVRDIMPFMTAETWSLEKMCCQSGKRNRITVVEGPSALRKDQVNSSLACTAIGIFMASLLIIAWLVWFEFMTKMVFIIIAAIIAFFFIPVVKKSVQFLHMYRSVKTKYDREDEGEEGTDNATIFQVRESLRITQPRPWLCWVTFYFSVIILFIYPLISMYVKNANIANVFLFLGGFSCIRMFFNPSSALEELGSLDDIDVKNINEGCSAMMIVPLLGVSRMEGRTAKLLRAKARISNVLGKVTKNDSVGRWFVGFSVLVALTMFMLLGTNLAENDYDNTLIKNLLDKKGVLPIGEFYYKPQETIAYPTCNLQKGFVVPGIDSFSLLDFDFLSSISYADYNQSTLLVDQWFGTNVVVDESDLVTSWRRQNDNSYNPVSFKLYTFPSLPGTGLVSVRGSETNWDWLVNMQLWSAAGLVQIISAFMPIGWIWNSILHDVVGVMTKLESKKLQSEAYYKVTTKFVRDMVDSGLYPQMMITGASLGGGIAIITGAQTNVSAVAISGINAMLSRDAYDPPLSVENINTRTFNVIPDRDPISHVGGRGRLFQEVQCTASSNSLWACHSMWRTMCELMYSCGTGGRPVLCRCHQMFGYPKPIQNGTRTFDEACAASADL